MVLFHLHGNLNSPIGGSIDYSSNYRPIPSPIPVVVIAIINNQKSHENPIFPDASKCHSDSYSY